MSGILRFIGIVNAAIWFGAGVFFAAGILPGVFSQEMHTLFREAAGATTYSGAVALLLFKRFFLLQYICGAVAVLHLLAEKLYLGRTPSRWGTALVVIIFALGLLGGLALQPRMENLRHTMYAGRTQEQRDQARHSFGLWHGISEFTNLLILGGLLAHLVRVTRPADPGRYGTFYQIP